MIIFIFHTSFTFGTHFLCVYKKKIEIKIGSMMLALLQVILYRNILNMRKELNTI